MKDLTIKPHHFLDVFKLHGRGLDVFVPDLNYNHDFYLVGNDLLNQKYGTITFTVGSDDICMPCKYSVGGTCTDIFVEDGIEKTKEKYNRCIDTILLKELGLHQNQAYGFEFIMEKINSCLCSNIINKAWNQNSTEENNLRYYETKKGIDKLTNKITKSK